MNLLFYVALCNNQNYQGLKHKEEPHPAAAALLGAEETAGEDAHPMP